MEIFNYFKNNLGKSTVFILFSNSTQKKLQKHFTSRFNLRQVSFAYLNKKIIVEINQIFM